MPVTLLPHRHRVAVERHKLFTKHPKLGSGTPVDVFPVDSQTGPGLQLVGVASAESCHSFSSHHPLSVLPPSFYL